MFQLNEYIIYSGGYFFSANIRNTRKQSDLYDVFV